MKVLVRLCLAAVLALGATGLAAGSHGSGAAQHVNRADEPWCC